MTAEPKVVRSHLPPGLVQCRQIPVRAKCIGERIDLPRFQLAERLAQNPVLIALDDDCVATLSRYGVVVLFNVAPEHEEAFLQQLMSLVHQPDSVARE
jgi:hypothetical protein